MHGTHTHTSTKRTRLARCTKHQRKQTKRWGTAMRGMSERGRVGGVKTLFVQWHKTLHSARNSPFEKKQKKKHPVSSEGHSHGKHTAYVQTMDTMAH